MVPVHAVKDDSKMTGLNKKMWRTHDMESDPKPIVHTANVRFSKQSNFLRDLRARVDAHFKNTGEPRRDLPSMYLKSLVILTWFVGSWALLVFAASTAWQAALLSISLGLAIGAIGMNIQHDGNHSAFSKYPWLNRAAGLTLDVMGVCSFIWRQRHNVIHHTGTNIHGFDEDFNFGMIARLSTQQPHRFWHPYQQYYCWFLYGFLLPKWGFVDDFITFSTGRLGEHKMARFGWKDKAHFFGWKLFFLGWAIIIPSLYHPVWQVLLCYLLTVFTLGLTLASVFQLAHVVEEADFPLPGEGDITEDWGAHQMNTTVDFGRENRLLTWYLGGLNFQVEHHLFPQICHLHYPELSRIVEKVAAEHGIRYRHNKTFRSALASHFRYVRRLGKVDAQPTAAVGKA